MAKTIVLRALTGIADSVELLLNDLIWGKRKHTVYPAKPKVIIVRVQNKA